MSTNEKEKKNLAASNDKLEASLSEWSRKTGVELVAHSPQRGAARLAPAELAPAIRQQNLARAKRASNEELDSARVELMRAFSGMHDNVFKPEDLEMFLSAMREYFTALVAPDATTQRAGFRAMHDSVASLRESIAALDRFRAGDRT